MAGVDSSDMPPKAYLFLQDGERYFRFFFTKPRVLLGRAEDNDIVVRDDAILPRHAEVFVAGPDYQLVAVAGSHTELNDEKVEGVKTLRNGDEIRLGPIHLLYVEEHRTSETALNLIIQREGDIPFGVTINKPMVRVGRRHGDVLIDDDTISDTHLLIENFCEHGVFALDMRSERGTLLNGQPLDARRRIDDGDTIDIGTTHILVRIRRAGEARARRSASRSAPEVDKPAGGGSHKPPGGAPERVFSRLPERPPEHLPDRGMAGSTQPRPVVPAPPLPASRAEPSFAIHAHDAPSAEPPVTGRARIRRSADHGPDPAPLDRVARAPERPRVPQRSEPEPSVVAEASDGRVRNTLRMPLSPGDMVPAAPWQGRTESHQPHQSIVSIDGPVRSSPEPLLRPPRRAVPGPEERPSRRQGSREPMAEPQQRVSYDDGEHYHYLPGGAARDAGSDPSPRQRGRAEGDGPTQREYLPDTPPPRRREHRGADDAFKSGMTVTLPSPDAGTRDDGTDDDGGGRYYHPGSSRRR